MLPAEQFRLRGKEFQAFLDTDSARLEKVIRKMGKTQ